MDSILTIIAILLALVTIITNAVAAFKARQIRPDVYSNLYSVNTVLRKIVDNIQGPLSKLSEPVDEHDNPPPIPKQWSQIAWYELKRQSDSFAELQKELAKQDIVNFEAANYDAAEARMWILMGAALAALCAAFQIMVAL